MSNDHFTEDPNLVAQVVARLLRRGYTITIGQCPCGPECSLRPIYMQGPGGTRKFLFRARQLTQEEISG